MGYYGEISKGYDALHFEEQAEKARIIKSSCCCGLRGLLLDIGAGTGSITKLFESGETTLIALDPSKEMLRNYAGLKVVARAEQLPFKNACFDSVVSLTALHHADLANAKKEIFRVARPNACIAISFFKRAKNFALAKSLFADAKSLGKKPPVGGSLFSAPCWVQAEKSLGKNAPQRLFLAFRQIDSEKDLIFIKQ